MTSTNVERGKFCISANFSQHRAHFEMQKTFLDCIRQFLLKRVVRWVPFSQWVVEPYNQCSGAADVNIVSMVMIVVSPEVTKP